MAGKRWTTGDVNYLIDSWGTYSIDTICKKLGRSKCAVRNKVKKLGLGPFLQNGDYITFRQVVDALGYNGTSGKLVKSWIENRKFPVRNKKVGRRLVRVVILEEFWRWAEKNQSFLDFSKFEPMTLGVEPNWVKKKREYDIKNKTITQKKLWTQKEDEYLIFLLNQYKYSYKDISQKMNRSEGAINRRIIDLKLKQRPIKADNYTPWTEEEKVLVKKMILEGASYELISRKLNNRGSLCVKSLIARMYKTEALDKVRNKINSENILLGG